MSQITSGIKGLLSSPAVYLAWQSLLGAKRMHEMTCAHLRLRGGEAVLDIGCGPAEILELLPPIDYVGVDMSEIYIERARRRFATRGRFHVGNVYDLDSMIAQEFNAIIAQGLLHHLDDAEAETLFRFAARKLAPGGRLVTVDPARTERLSPLARLLVEHDRGRDVRSPDGYEAVARRAFSKVRHDLQCDLLRLPYTLCYMVCEN